MIEAGPCPVVQVRTKDVDGYDAVQLAFDAVADRKLTKPELGHLAKFEVGRAPARWSSSAAASTARSRARPSPSPSSSPATRSRSRASASARASRARSSVTTSVRGPRSHGSHNIRKPGSIGASATPSRVFKGVKMAGRMGGKRVTQLGLHRARRRRRAEPAARQGRGPGPEERPRRGERLMAAPKAPLLDADGGKKAQGRLARRGVFAAEIKPHLVHEAVRAELNAGRAGTARDEEPRARLGRPREAVASEGHGPRAPGHDSRAAVHRRRPRLRQGAAHVRPEGQPQGGEGRAALRARESRRRRGRSRSSTPRRSMSRRRRRPRASSRARACRRRSCSSRSRRGAGADPELPQPRPRRGRRRPAELEVARRRLGALAARQRGRAARRHREGAS